MNYATLMAVLTFTLWTQAAAPARPPQNHRPKQYTIEQFLHTTSVSGASFSADESRMFSSNKAGVWNAYTIPAAGGTWTPGTR
jgi:hypothetical protein